MLKNEFRKKVLKAKIFFWLLVFSGLFDFVYTVSTNNFSVGTPIIIFLTVISLLFIIYLLFLDGIQVEDEVLK